MNKLTLAALAALAMMSGGVQNSQAKGTQNSAACCCKECSCEQCGCVGDKCCGSCDGGPCACSTTANPEAKATCC